MLYLEYSIRLCVFISHLLYHTHTDGTHGLLDYIIMSIWYLIGYIQYYYEYSINLLSPCLKFVY